MSGDKDAFGSFAGLPLDEPPARPPVDHDNLRGAAYYEETYADPSDD